MVNTPFLDFDSDRSERSFELDLNELGEQDSQVHTIDKLE